MDSKKYIENRLKDQMTLLEHGHAAEALQGLSLILAELDSTRPEQALNCAAVLRLMSRAAQLLGDEEGRLRFLERAVKLVQNSVSAPINTQVEVFLGLAECLSRDGQVTEAMHFAEASLEGVAAKPDNFAEDELAEILRRYTEIARLANCNTPAYLALTFALLLIHKVSGLESRVAGELLDFAGFTCDRGSTRAVARVGKFVAHTCAFNEW